MRMAQITISIARTLAIALQMPCNVNGAWTHKLWTAQAAALNDMKNAPDYDQTVLTARCLRGFLASCIDIHSSYLYQMKAKMP